MLKKILAVVVIVLAVLAIIISMRPEKFHAERSATFAAPPEKVFAQVNDLRAMDTWSPWSKIDPNATSTYEGPQAGVGAIMRWDGNMEVGKGSMTITESRSNERVKYQLDFVKPFKSTAIAQFTLQPANDRTTVTWSMDGNNNFIGKAIGLFMDCEKMIGEQFEKGLASLKEVVEK